MMMDLFVKISVVISKFYAFSRDNSRFLPNESLLPLLISYLVAEIYHLVRAGEPASIRP